MKKIIVLVGLLSMNLAVNANQRCVVTQFVNHSTAETAEIKRHFSERYLRGLSHTFDTKILPRLRLEGNKLIYHHADRGKARIDLSTCKMGTVILMQEEPKFKCTLK